jgi:hypothetical protein
MDEQELFELVHEAVAQALEKQLGGPRMRLARRLVGGRVLFEDDQGREVRAVPVEGLFKKITSVRDKLRVLEQKINSSDRLDLAEKAEFQDQITRAYGSLTTFNFLFEEEVDRFKGTGG